MSGNKFKYAQGIAIRQYGLESQGVCWELCRHWIRGHIQGTWQPGSSIWDVDTGRGGFGEVLEQHRGRSLYNEANKALEGYDFVNSARRRSGAFKKKGLRSRTDVIEHVMTVPGVYLFILTGPDSGHAMAFDSSVAGTVHFFDPNQGEWEFHGETLDQMRTWWSNWWEGNDSIAGDAIDYKSHFHNGARELVRYTTA